MYQVWPQSECAAFSLDAEASLYHVKRSGQFCLCQTGAICWLIGGTFLSLLIAFFFSFVNEASDSENSCEVLLAGKQNTSIQDFTSAIPNHLLLGSLLEHLCLVYERDPTRSRSLFKGKTMLWCPCKTAKSVTKLTEKHHVGRFKWVWTLWDRRMHKSGKYYGKYNKSYSMKLLDDFPLPSSI